MKILRTIIWVLAAAGFLIFAIYNWNPVELTLWQNLVLETKVPVLALLAFAVGFVPVWAYHLSVKWGLNRRVRALETSLKNSALVRQAEIVLPVDGSVDKPGTSQAQFPDPPAAPEAGNRGGAD